MLVKHLVLFVLLLFIDLGIFFPLPRQMGLAGVFRTDGTERNHFLQILMLTGGTLWRRGRRQQQILELMAASFTLIFIDWHSSPHRIP